MVVNTGEQEQNLALRAQAGDREALSQLVARLRNPLFALAFAELRHYDDAQDAVAAALFRICARIHTLRDPAQARSWMNTVVRNESRRLLRSRRTVRDDTGDEAARVVSHSTEKAHVLRLDIEAALRRLPQDHARAVALFYLSGLPVAEIARRLSRPEGTIKFWLHQGRRQLAPHLEGYNPVMQNPPTPPVSLSSQSPQSPWIAAIVSTEIPPDLLTPMKAALERSGWDTVHLIGDFATAARLVRKSGGDATELCAPVALQGVRCLILDERIGARSAFELIALLSATEERKNCAVFLLIDNVERNPDFDLTVMAAYVAGVDMLLSKPFDLAEFEQISKRLRDTAAIPLPNPECRATPT